MKAGQYVICLLDQPTGIFNLGEPQPMDGSRDADLQYVKFALKSKDLDLNHSIALQNTNFH